jgi:hypothetical protein
MKAATQAIPSRDNKAADPISFAQQRVRNSAMDEMYFGAEIRPAAAVYVGTGAADGMNSFAPVMVLPAGVLSSASMNVAARQLWVKTRPQVTIWYTATVGSTNTFNFRFVAVFFGAGGTTTGPFWDVAWTAPGPAVANVILTTQVVITSGVFLSSPFGVVRFQIQRQGPDANANDLQILLASVKLQEVA